MEYVVNEWLPEYFKSSDKNEQQKLEKFLNGFYDRKDKIFIKRPSPFLEKLYRYVKDLQTDHIKHLEFKKFIANIIRNTDICRFIEENECKNALLADDILSKLEQGNYISDKYLFETAMHITQNEKIIITTDKKLIQQVRGIEPFRVIHLDDFLSEFLQQE